MPFTPKETEDRRARRREYMRQWRASDRNRERVYKMRSRYGIGPDDYERMHAEQEGLCAICREPETARHASGATKALSVDHCHDTGRVRGLLCHRCNRVLGLLNEDRALLTAATDYLSEEAR